MCDFLRKQANKKKILNGQFLIVMYLSSVSYEEFENYTTCSTFELNIA